MIFASIITKNGKFKEQYKNISNRIPLIWHGALSSKSPQFLWVGVASGQHEVAPLGLAEQSLPSQVPHSKGYQMEDSGSLIPLYLTHLSD